MRDTLKLPLVFDSTRLKADLNGILDGEYIPHFNTRYYEGDWSVVPLRSIDGAANQIYPDPTKNTFADTPLLARCTYIKEVLATFQCDLLSARFLRLATGSTIKEHRDYNLSLEDGEARLHIPVTTNPEVEFFLNDERVVMNEGECWYLNLNLKHRVANRGTTDRVHLVVDCVVNDWFRNLLSEASISTATA
jgi:hypothetical protein